MSATTDYSHPPTETQPTARTLLAWSLLLAALTVAAFWGVWQLDFISHDDPTYIVDNPHLRGGLSASSIAWATTTLYFANWHPVTWWSYLVDYSLGGGTPGLFHATNLLLHAMNVVLLFLLLAGMTRALGRSGFVAALFAVHPLHVESVVWISQRKDLLSTLFGLLAIGAWWLSIRPAKTPSTDARPPLRMGWYLGALVLYALSLMSKQMLVTLPLLLLLLDVWPLRRAHVGGRRLILEVAPFAILAAIASAIIIMAQQASGAVASLTGYPLWVRVTNAVAAYGLYVRRTLWPSDLAIAYPHPGENIALGSVAVWGVLFAVVTLISLAQIRKRPWLAVGWLWFIVALLPVIGLVQVGMQQMADRYSYVPLIGLFLAVAWLPAKEGMNSAALRKAITAAAALLVLASALLTRAQLAHWQSDEALFRHALAVTDKNWLAADMLGSALYKAGRRPEAEAEFRRAIEFDPTYALPHRNLAALYLQNGQAELALQHAEAAAALEPNNADGHVQRGAALAASGRTDEAALAYRSALELDPTNPIAHNNLGNHFRRLGQLQEAEAEYRAALAANPDFVNAHRGLAAVLRDTGRADEAAQHEQRIAELGGTTAPATTTNPEWEKFMRAGLALGGQGQFDKAAEQFQKATEADPANADGWFYWGFALINANNIPAAEPPIREALARDPNHAEAHNALGMIERSRGNTAAAIAAFKEALRHRPDFAAAAANLRALEGQ